MSASSSAMSTRRLCASATRNSRSDSTGQTDTTDGGYRRDQTSGYSDAAYSSRYPNRQRNGAQTSDSVGSNPTRGTRDSPVAAALTAARQGPLRRSAGPV